MAKRTYYHYYYSCCFALSWFISFGQNVEKRTDKENLQYYTQWVACTQGEKENLLHLMKEADVRQALLDNARKETYVKEKTNHNDHPRIDYYNIVARSSHRAPYCAAGQFTMAKELGLNYNLRSPAAVRGWFVDKNTIIYTHGKWIRNAQLMDYIWIFGSHLEALAQPNIDPDIEPDDEIITIGFNTSGGKRQHGVYYPLWRKWGDVQMMTNQVSPALTKLKHKYENE
jgi:hypothetical protein